MMNQDLQRSSIFSLEWKSCGRYGKRSNLGEFAGWVSYKQRVLSLDLNKYMYAVKCRPNTVIVSRESKQRKAKPQLYWRMYALVKGIVALQAIYIILYLYTIKIIINNSLGIILLLNCTFDRSESYKKVIRQEMPDGQTIDVDSRASASHSQR